MNQIVQMAIFVGGILFIGIAFLIGFWVYLTQFKCRKIKVPLYELKRDGGIKRIGFDILKEKKILPKGKVWTGKKSKGVWLKPDSELIDVYKQKGKLVEECPYLRVGKYHMPADIRADININNKASFIQKIVKIFEGDVLANVTDESIHIPLTQEFAKLKLDVPNENLGYNLIATEENYKILAQGWGERIRELLLYGSFALVVVAFILGMYFITKNMGHEVASAVSSLDMPIDRLAGVLGG